MARYALEAISEDEDAAAAAGVNVTFEKLRITVISALMTAFAGALYCQYQMFISPDTVSGIGVSLQMVFAVVVGGIYVALGPTVGAIITIALAEGLRIFFGTKAVGWDNLVYGVLLVLFIIFLPKGILGSLLERVRVRRRPAAAPQSPSGAARPRTVSVGSGSALDAGRQGRPLQQLGRDQHVAAQRLGRVEQARRHVQRVADIGDLAAHVADFAGDDLAAMQGGAELGHDAEALAVALAARRR